MLIFDILLNSTMPNYTNTFTPSSTPSHHLTTEQVMAQRAEVARIRMEIAHRNNRIELAMERIHHLRLLLKTAVPTV